MSITAALPRETPITGPADLMVVRHVVRVALAHSALPPIQRTRVATGVSQLARSLLAEGGGEMTISARDGMLFIRLPGLPDEARGRLFPRGVEVTGHTVCLPLADVPDSVVPASRLHGLQLRERQLEHARRSARDAHAALEAKSRRLAGANEDLEMVAAAAAHDLKEPLQVIRLFAAALARQPASERPAQQIRSATDRMSDMLEGLMALLQVGGPDLDHRTPIRPALRGVLDDLTFLGQRTGAKVEVIGSGWVAMAEPHLRAVLQNLVANAMKYAREGVPPRIRVEIVQRTMVEIRVVDNGMGIPASEHARVFTLFKRLQRDRTSDGTGVGLAFVSRVVRAYEGSIRIEERPDGPGTSFVVTLPAPKPLPSPPRPPLQPPEPPPGPSPRASSSS